MKFLLNKAFLASLALGVASGKAINDIQVEDLQYWRELVDAVDSFPATVAPTKAPIISPTPAPVVSPTSPPTEAPVAACATIGMLRVAFVKFSLFYKT